MSSTLSERTLESELRDHNAATLRLSGEADVAKAAAEALVASEYAAGRNPQDATSESFDSVDKAYLVADELAGQAAKHRDAASRIMSLLGQKATAKSSRSGTRLIDAIVSSPEYRRLAETGAFHSAGSHIELPGIEVATAAQVVENIRSGLPMFSATVDVDGGTPGGGLITPDERRWPPVGIPVRQIRLLDLITMTTTSSDLIDYVEEVLRTDAAAETALGTAYGEASYAYELRQALVKDIGHFTPAHRSNMADEGQLQGLIEGRLQTGVELRFESQLVSGDGIGENLLGILNTDNIGHVERNGTTSERLLEVIHRGITTVRLSLFQEPDAIGIHPTSYEHVVFEKDEIGGPGTGQYLLGPASQATSKNLWGFPAVVSSVFPTNTALVGAYKVGAIGWVRSGVAVRASDSHEDFFSRRMVALLAEMRAAFAAWQPRAFCEVDLT